MRRLPARVQALFEGQLKSSVNKNAMDAEPGSATPSEHAGLPTYYADEGGQWGTRVPMPPSRQLGSDAKLGRFLPCKASGMLIESGRSVTVFPCGHMVLVEKSAYGACPCCPISGSGEEEII